MRWFDYVVVSYISFMIWAYIFAVPDIWGVINYLATYFVYEFSRQRGIL